MAARKRATRWSSIRWVQYLVARGYAVFQPNFRGSDGFGRKFAESGYGEWGRKMQDDLTDGVKALADQGSADPARVCIVGASYGGYAALAGAALTPTCTNARSRSPASPISMISSAGASTMGRRIRRASRTGSRPSATPTRTQSAAARSLTGGTADKIKIPCCSFTATDDFIVPDRAVEGHEEGARQVRDARPS